MKLGLLYVNVGPFADPLRFADLARAAEAEGIESIWAVDHAVVPVRLCTAYPYTEDGRLPLPATTDLVDPLVALSYAAAMTERIRLATGVLLVAQRHPAHVAKSLASLDRLSGGRALLGVGIGWLREEFDVLGVPFEQRAARTEECVRAIRTLWASEPQGFEGRYHRWAPVHSHPKPQQVRGVPIVIGGCVEASARRAARIGDGFFPVEARHSELSKLLDAMRDECAELGRDPATVEVSTMPESLEPDAIRSYRELGVHRLICAPPAFDREGLIRGLRDAVRNVASAH